MSNEQVSAQSVLDRADSLRRDLGDTVRLDKILVWNYCQPGGSGRDRGFNNVQIEYQLNGQWKTLADKNPGRDGNYAVRQATGLGDSYDLEVALNGTILADKIRITGLGNYGSTGDSGLNEVMFYTMDHSNAVAFDGKMYGWEVLDRTLLDRVADFKQVYFKAAWARYDEARPGTLRLTPGEQLADQLARDYDDMQPMFFSEPPPFREILGSLPELEQRINDRNP